MGVNTNQKQATSKGAYAEYLLALTTLHATLAGEDDTVEENFHLFM